jgi:DNA-directed RNA polymerase specialized sigma24 family protein
VRKALAAPRHQAVQVLQLRAEGLRYREIAEILDVSTTAVGNCVGRAIEKLKAELHV